MSAGVNLLGRSWTINLNVLISAIVFTLLFILILLVIAFLVHRCSKDNCLVDIKTGKKMELLIKPLNTIKSPHNNTHNDKE